ncbi:MAG: histidinol dehydrogenase [Firmicutes bacterium]|nr:histidinol dehydrogenase [Bacillota bacterium]
MIGITYITEANRRAFLAKAAGKSHDSVQSSYDNIRDAQKVVDGVIEDIKTRGDEALFYYTEKWDKVRLDAKSAVLYPDGIAEIAKRLEPEKYGVIARAAKRIEKFHALQKQKSWFETGENGEILGQLVTPVESVGAYAPGGTAVLSSSLLMCVIPARVAGVKSVAVCTPADGNGEISPALAAAAHIAGVDIIYKFGGAQAIAALAYGTETVQKVDKVVGPGNLYVALAKKSVFGQVGIDSIAGPSEITVIADAAANPAYVAADMLSQAEHIMGSAICLTDSAELAAAVQLELERQIRTLPTGAAAAASLRDNGAIAVVPDIRAALALSNEIAPEHLELCVGEAFSFLPLVKNAGAVFLGPYTPEPVGDYYAGPNHILPTDGKARFFSPLCVDDFVKKTSVISFSEEALRQAAADVTAFAEMEKLSAHAEAVRIRL